MIVLTLTNCPPGLKGDVTKWLIEISTGVFVGKLSARVRENLWKRVCEHCGSGEATMVFSARNEQGFSFYVHNTVWKPTDFDGIVLIKKPLPPNFEKKSSEKKRKKSGRKKEAKKPVVIDISDDIVNNTISAPCDFVAIDIETTGLKSGEDSIIEIGAVKYIKGQPVSDYHSLVKSDSHVPEVVETLTGISDEMLNREGRELKDILNGFIEFIGNDILIGHYISFDIRFIQKACQRLDISFGDYNVIDTIKLAKAFLKVPIQSYKLEELVKVLDISDGQVHRALPDASLAANLYLKLNE